MTIDSLYTHFQSSTGICTDNRKATEGNIFFALTGERFNGNKFAEEAITKGCALAIIDDAAYRLDDRFILVDDVLETLQSLAGFHRQQLKASLVAITGSNGKTTCKELAYAVLSKGKRVFATPGNFNNHIGLPLTLLQTPIDTEVLLLEMGDSKQGDVTELCKISNPDLGYITNIGKDHIGGFGSMENNIRAKAEIFEFLAGNQKPCIVQEDALIQSIVPPNAVVIRLPISNDGNSDLKPVLGESMLLSYQSGDAVYETGLVGAYNMDNISFAVSLGRYYGIHEADIHEAITSYRPGNNRSQAEDSPTGNKLILDAYNANPSSVMEALKSLAGIKSSKQKGVILGDMLELGDISQTEHADIVDFALRQNFEFAIFIGELFYEHQTSKALFFKTKQEAELFISENPFEDSMILLKGSRGIALETLKPLL